MTGHHASRSFGQPVRVSMCRRLACQRRTGCLHGAQARFATADVQVAGAPTEDVRIGDEGGARRFHFCSRRGATVCTGFDDEFTAMPVGVFVDPALLPLQMFIHEERRHPWANVPDGAQHVH